MVEPRIVHRPEQSYVGITATVSMDTFALIADRFGEIAGWLVARGGVAAGPAFFRYHLIDMPDRLVVTAGVPVAEPLTGEGDIEPGTLPAGAYVTVLHHGSPEHPVAVTADLLAWSADQDLEFAVQPTEHGEAWVARLEIYYSDPRTVPSWDDWNTELAFKLA